MVLMTMETLAKGGRQAMDDFESGQWGRDP